MEDDRMFICPVCGDNFNVLNHNYPNHIKPQPMDLVVCQCENVLQVMPDYSLRLADPSATSQLDEKDKNDLAEWLPNYPIERRIDNWETECPSCHMKLNGTVAVKQSISSKRPKTGDISLCLHCGAVLQFVSETKMVPADPDYLASLPEEHQRIVRLAQEQVLNGRMKMKSAWED